MEHCFHMGRVRFWWSVDKKCDGCHGAWYILMEWNIKTAVGSCLDFTNDWMIVHPVVNFFVNCGNLILWRLQCRSIGGCRCHYTMVLPVFGHNCNREERARDGVHTNLCMRNCNWSDRFGSYIVAFRNGTFTRNMSLLRDSVV